MVQIKLDKYLAKRKKCPYGHTYKATWNEMLCKHVEPFDEVCRVGSIACSRCKYFDESNFGQEERPKYIMCNFKK